MRHKEAAAQRLRQAHAGRHLVARMIEILARGKWLPRPRRYAAAMPTEIPLDTIDDVLSHVASAARCWEVFQSQYLQRPSPYAARRTSPGCHRADLPDDRDHTSATSTHHTKGSEAGNHPMRGVRSPAHRDLSRRGPDAALARSGRIRGPAGCCCGRFSGYARKIVPFTASQ